MGHPPKSAGRARRRLVLWRHGRTEWNVQQRAQGHADIALDPVGREQARRAASALAEFRPVFVWTSDLERARDTARELSVLTGLEWRTDVRLREYQVGIRQGMTIAEFRDRHPEVYRKFIAEDDYRVPGAELPSEVDARMTTVLQEAADALDPGDTGVLVGHGAALRSGLLAFFDAPFRLRNIFAPMANGAWTVLEEHPEWGWQVADYNARTLPDGPAQLADEMPPHRAHPSARVQ